LEFATFTQRRIVYHHRWQVAVDDDKAINVGKAQDKQV
jgi:hypothetical protein